MASLPCLPSWPGTGSTTTPSALERAASRSIPRPARYSSARSTCVAYWRVALSSKTLCDFESIGISFVLPLHDELYGVSLHATPVADEDMKCGVDGGGLASLLVERTKVSVPPPTVLHRFATVVDKHRSKPEGRPVSSRSPLCSQQRPPVSPRRPPLGPAG